MPLDADLWTINLKTSEKTETVESKVMKINDFDDDQKKKLDTEFAQSEVWKSLKSKLDAIKSDVNKTTEWKKNDMVTLLKDFFDVWDDKDEHIKRFVVDWKSYLRINDGEHNFDIELSDALMPSLVDRFLATSEAQINEWVSKEEEKIKVKYENKTEEAIKKTKEELKELKDGVSSTESVEEDFRDRQKFKKDPWKWVKWLWPWLKNTLGAVKSFFTDTIPSLWTTIKETVTWFSWFSLWWLLGKKESNETKPA